jgi:hypothetical protein
MAETEARSIKTYILRGKGRAATKGRLSASTIVVFAVRIGSPGAKEVDEWTTRNVFRS